MATKNDIEGWVVQILKSKGGSLHYVDIAKGIWKSYESELRKSGDLFYTWQYDMRWAGNRLRKSGAMKAADISPSGIWQLA